MGNFTMDLPPDGLVNFNIAITLVFSLIIPPLHGLVLLPVLVLRKLRRQSYQYLYSNYLASSLAVILGFGFYRAVQIWRYLLEGYEVGVEKTACNIMKFFEFPLTTSNLCLSVIGYERFVVLHYNKNTDWPTMLFLIALPWGLGICRHSIELCSPNRYQSVPYLGLCTDISEEKNGGKIISLLFDFVVPMTLALFTISAAYTKAYSRWKRIKVQQKQFLSSTEITKLRHEKRSVLKITKTINMAAAFYILRFCTSLIFRVLYSQVEDDSSPQELRDQAGVVGVFFLLLNVAINPILFFIFNSDLRKAVCDKMPMLMKIPLIYPYDEDNDEEETAQVELITMEDITAPN